MSIVPDFVLWNSTETGIIYQIPNVTRTNEPQDPGRFIEIESLRGQGSIIIPGADPAPWDLELDFVLCGTDYEDIIDQIDEIESTIVKNTKYVLKIDRTSTTTKDYKVKRLQPIIWESSKRISTQRGTLVLRVNSWS